MTETQPPFPCSSAERFKSKTSKKRRRNAVPVTQADVDQFLASWTALNYLRFEESNVKRRVIRMLIFLRSEVDRLECQLAAVTPTESKSTDAAAWAKRVRQ